MCCAGTTVAVAAHLSRFEQVAAHRPLTCHWQAFLPCLLVCVCSLLSVLVQRYVRASEEDGLSLPLDVSHSSVAPPQPRLSLARLPSIHPTVHSTAHPVRGG